jgi:excisionase family DNA binding protein
MVPDEPQRREVLSPDQLAEYLGCGRTTVYELLRERRIPSFTVGRLRRIRRCDVERYVSDLLANDIAHAR